MLPDRRDMLKKIGLSAGAAPLALLAGFAMFDLACATSASAAQTGPVTTSPKGTYEAAQLELSEGVQDADDKNPPAPQQLILALRDGKLVNLWFVRPFAGDRRLAIQRSTLVLNVDTLAGAVELRTAFNRETPQIGMTLSLSLTLRNGAITGTYELAAAKAPYKPSKGTAAGKLVTEPVADALAPRASWESFWGSNGDMSAGTQPPLVADLAKARPVWRSETYIPTGYGNAPDSRYFTRALVSGDCGGAVRRSLATAACICTSTHPARSPSQP